MDEIYRRISKSIVKVKVDDFFCHGFIADCEPNFACVLSSTQPVATFEYSPVVLVFPGRKAFLPVKSEIVINDGIATIPCHFNGDEVDSSLLESLKICRRPPSLSDKVYTYSAYKDDTEGIITPGSVISVGEKSFRHNCSARKDSEKGGLVINRDGQLVGLCTDFDRNLTARYVSDLA